FLATAWTKLEVVKSAVHGLLLHLGALQLLQLLGQQFLFYVQTQLQDDGRVDAEQETPINIEVETLRIVSLWFNGGNTHSDTISHSKQDGYTFSYMYTAESTRHNHCFLLL